MGMFDYYEPRSSFSCPVCGTAHQEWQGTDGPCGLFLFREGVAGAFEQRVDEECRLSPEQTGAQSLPAEFSVRAYDCACPYPTVLLCHAPAGEWQSSELFTGSPADRQLRGAETRVQWQARLRWLDTHAP
jgi:hypothetical protein